MEYNHNFFSRDSDLTTSVVSPLVSQSVSQSISPSVTKTQKHHQIIHK